MPTHSLLTIPIRLVLGVVVLGSLAGTARPLRGSEWTQFRGLHGDGVSHLSDHPTQWTEETNISWKIKVDGVAWSQPIVWNDRVLLTTAVADDQPRPRIGEAGPGFRLFSAEGISRSFFGGGTPPATIYRWKLMCLDLATGQQRWERLVREGRPTIPIHRSNSYASETPITDGKHIYVYIAMVGLFCFDMEGNEVWDQPLDAQSIQYGWGTGSSPRLHEDTLYVVCDNEQESYLVAFEKTTGHQRWRVERDELSNWSTPYLWRNQKRLELVTCGGKKARSYDPGNGQLLWELQADGRCATTAVGDDELLYVGSVTRSMGSSGTLTAIRAGASGDLSNADTSGPNPFVAWSHARTAPELSSPLLYQGCLYLLSQHGGIVRCLDAKSGKQLYRKRLPRAGGFTASPWAAAGHVFCLDENGNTFVLETGPQLNVVQTNPLNGMFWSSAALAEGTLLLRSVDHLYRIAAP